MSEIAIRRSGRAGRITLNRPQALNALTWEMCLAIEAALDDWRDDDGVDLVIVDAIGERAFCAGGDIAEMYRTARTGEFGYGRRFWTDEYRMNARIAEFPKPYIAFMQGFTMGGGVGISGHGSHRIVGDTSRVSMPECGIGLIPDVGGTLLLARAPGRLGEYLGTTGHRMGPGDAILAGFADAYIPEDRWPDLIAALEKTGDAGLVASAAGPVPEARLAAQRGIIDRVFAADTMTDILTALGRAGDGFPAETASALGEKSPLALCCTLELVRRVREVDAIRPALTMEYRFTYRSAEQGDFLEGIRAAIIDRDRNPRWKHGSVDAVREMEVAAMLMPLGPDDLTFATG